METNIRGYGYYSVSDDGRVYSLVYKRKVELKQSEHKGYRRVALSSRNKRKIYPVHRLVADAFVPNPHNKPFVNHIDGNRRNNHYTNLEWCTREENQKHSREVLGNTGRGVKNSNWGNRVSKFYPSQELRNRLIELGIPRHKHDIVSLGEMLPETAIIQNGEIGRLEITFRIYNEVGNKEWDVGYTADNDFRSEFADSLANAMAKMLIYLLENKLTQPPKA